MRSACTGRGARASAARWGDNGRIDVIEGTLAKGRHVGGGIAGDAAVIDAVRSYAVLHLHETALPPAVAGRPARGARAQEPAGPAEKHQRQAR